MKKCVIVSDTFKGTLSSREIGEIAGEAVTRIFPGCEVVTVPVADGGEGTVECFMEALHTPPVSVEVQGPYGETVLATYTRTGTKAVIEMASAAGLPLVGTHRDPATASTYGVGQLIRHAVAHGCKEILLGLGGSATNDGGCGCAAALGVEFLDAGGNCFIPTGGTLSQIARIDLEPCRRLLRDVHITAMCDITNPLFGPQGAAYVFGPQKGADPAMVLLLDQQLRCLDRQIEQAIGYSVAQCPGAGAAGGMGAGCVAFFGAELMSGIDAILNLVDFDARIEGADLIITGEGRIDAQSVSGKVLSGILKRTRTKDIPVIALVGGISESAASAYEMGVTAMFSINREALDFEKSACKSRENYQKTLEDILRLVKAVERRNSKNTWERLIAMKKTEHYEAYVQILKEELVPAMGCTEPIAIALAAAKAREVLGCVPERCTVEVSGNIIKNVKAVTVPNTGGLKGIEAAAAIGLTAGKAELELEVLSQVTAGDIEAMKAYLAGEPITVVPFTGDRVFYIAVTVEGEGHTASCEIMDYHTNITKVTKDGEVLHQKEAGSAEAAPQTDRSVLSVKEIVAFADCLDISDVADTIRRQIAYNSAISAEGLKGGWGGEIGKTLRGVCGDDVGVRAKAAAAAGADARMSGCDMPVIIVSGSGNQGMTTSLPVIEYAKEMNAAEEDLIRALAVANLVTVHQKTGIGRLSAFCGAVSAGCGAAAGIAYLNGGRYDVIAHTIANTLAICSGMVCDGAKPSCAAKIAVAVEAGLLGYQMYAHGGHQFRDGEGITKKGVENTISNVGRLAREGMRRTDEEILHIMVDH